MKVTTINGKVEVYWIFQSCKVALRSEITNNHLAEVLKAEVRANKTKATTHTHTHKMKNP